MKRAWLGFVLSLLLLCTHNAIAQRGTSQIDTITIQANGSTIGTAAAPFRINFPGCTGSRPGGVFTISCSSVMVYPGAGLLRWRLTLRSWFEGLSGWSEAAPHYRSNPTPRRRRPAAPSFYQTSYNRRSGVPSCVVVTAYPDASN